MAALAPALPFIAAGTTLLGAAASARQTQALAAQSRQQRQVELRNAKNRRARCDDPLAGYSAAGHAFP